MTVDPHQLTNMISKMPPQFLAEENKQLIKLSVCKGASCREVHPPDYHDNDYHHLLTGDSAIDNERNDKLLFSSDTSSRDFVGNRFMNDKEFDVV